jgi:hypothetical protein
LREEEGCSMQIKKTIWIPVSIGMITATLILLVSEARFVIPLGNNYSIGIGEILNTLSAALGGPIALIITVMVTGVGHFLLNPYLYTDTQFIFIALSDAFIHLCAMLVVAFSYYRVLNPWVRKTGAFIMGWWLIIGVYYYLILLPLQVVLLDYADPGYGATYPSFAKIFLPEFLGTAAITTLIWFALPARYRRPQWVGPKTAPDQNLESRDK